MRISRNARVTLMAITVIAIASFNLFSTGWAIPASAQCGVGTVPGGNCGTGGTGGATNQNPSGPAAGACGAGAQTFTVNGSDNVTKLLNVGIGSAAFLSNVGGVGSGVIRILFVPIVSLTANLVSVAALNPSPAGWTALSCGIVLSGTVSDGEAVTYIVRGQEVCFNLPVGATAAYNFLRIAYWDTRLSRWVFLNTIVGATQACHYSYRLAPSTFVLFGGA